MLALSLLHFDCTAQGCEESFGQTTLGERADNLQVIGLGKSFSHISLHHCQHLILYVVLMECVTLAIFDLVLVGSDKPFEHLCEELCVSLVDDFHALLQVSCSLPPPINIEEP